MAWRPEDAPRLDGQVVVVTGANSGLGFETSRVLAARGAHVIMACRNPAKAADAHDRIADAVPSASLDVRALDLASLDSVRAFADSVRTDHRVLAALVNNAGVMALPRCETADGFEMQIGTNHLGHFVLTARLLDRLDGGRIVHVSSMAHRMGRMQHTDPMGARRYQRWLQYGFSKLANLLFHYELARRLSAAGRDVLSLAAHPGYADTNLQHVGPAMDGNALVQWGTEIANRMLAQPGARGALPQLRAVLDPTARNGEFFGPDGPMQVWGDAVRVDPAPHALRVADQAALWAWSERVTGEAFSDALPPSRD